MRRRQLSVAAGILFVAAVAILALRETAPAWLARSRSAVINVLR